MLNTRMTDIDWSVENEIQLFYAMMGHKPVGKQAHASLVLLHCLCGQFVLSLPSRLLIGQTFVEGYTLFHGLNHIFVADLEGLLNNTKPFLLQLISFYTPYHNPLTLVFVHNIPCLPVVLLTLTMC